MARLIFLGFFFFIVACNENDNERILFDFESDAELDRLQWKCHTFFQLSDTFATHGDKALKIDFHPSSYPGLTPVLDVNDWSGWRFFCFDIYNPGQDAVQIVVRIDDRKKTPPDKDRYHQKFLMHNGLNRIKIPLDAATTHVSKRKMNLGGVHRFWIYMVNPPEKLSLFIDYIRLEKKTG